ncbi:hypothetical protein LTR64_005668 [Lithohypha guttulata]|uniref:uncharacterized protein n=1 Tax=Lithohypha guttulata TaxID=1690604 RepID=UPI002DDF14AB|nr:hypothetical protein LTR51_002538 [Lithohypha guttulata]
MAYERVPSTWPRDRASIGNPDYELDDIADWNEATRLRNHNSLQSITSYNPSDHVPLISEAKKLSVSQTEVVHHRQWRPLSLRRWYLLLLCLILSALWVSLFLVWRLSRQEHGFKLTITSNHLSWKYGPTGILVIVVSLWRQVDYHCKSLQPWQNLTKGVVEAKQSLLLDYLWPLQLDSFQMAVRNKHWRVVMSTAGFMILKIVTLISTALIVAVDTLLPMEVTVRFDNTLSTTAAGNITLDPLDAYLGVLGGSIKPAEGLQNGMVFRTFDLVDNTTSLDSITSAVDVFVPRIDCEPADVKLLAYNQTSEDLADGAYYFNISMSTSTCPAIVNSSSAPYYFSKYIQIKDCKDTVCQGLFLSQTKLDCADTTYYNSSKNNTDVRYVASALNLTVTRSSISSLTLADYTPNIAGSAAVFCRIDHSLESWNVTRDLRSGDLSLAVLQGPRSERRLDDLNSQNLTETLSYMSTTDWTNPPSPGLVSGIRRTINNNVTFDYSQFFEKKNLLNATNITLAGVAAQYVQQMYMLPEGSRGQATAARWENRLHVQEAPLWGMIVGLIMVSLFSVVLAIYDSPTGLPQRPSSRVTMAAVLASSPKITSLLANTGQLSKAEFKQGLSTASFRAVTSQDAFTVDTSMSEFTARTKSTALPGHGDAWMPFAARKVAILLTMCMPIAAIVGLEAIYQISVRDDGLATVSISSASMKYVIPFVAPIVMTLIATMFNLLDFVIAVIAPFQALKRATKSASRLLFTDLLGHSPPIALHQSLRRRHYGSALSNIASLIGATLTIVASGLLVTESVIWTTDIAAERNSLWDWDWKNSTYTDRQAGESYERMRLNTSGPSRYVWGDYVFPDIQQPMVIDRSLNKSIGAINDTTMEYTLTFPTLRPHLECHIVPDRYTTYVWNDTLSTMNVSTSAPLKDGCRGGQGGDLDTITWASEYSIYSSTNRSYKSGYMYDLHLGPWNASKAMYLNYGEGDGTLDQPDNPAGCPSIGIHFGLVTILPNETNVITTLLCDQQVEEVQITYGMNTPSKVHNETAKFLTNGTAGAESFGFRMQRHLSLLYSGLGNQTAFALVGDHFFSVLNGSYRTVDELTGPQNVTKLIDAVQILYRRYMTNAIDRNFRKPKDQLSVGAQQANQSSTIRGTARVELLRLRVDDSSKIILQALLACMTVLGTMAYYLVEIRGVLPRNPCSIASTMSFFAGSSMCDRKFMPLGAEWMAEEELRPLFDQHTFSLGWWACGQPGQGDADLAEEYQSQVKYGMRFGVDRGRAILLGFSQREKWYQRGWKRLLGRRDNVSRSSYVPVTNST